MVKWVSWIMLNLYLLEGKTNYCWWLTMQFTYRFTSRYTPCILQNSHYNHVKVNIAPTKSPQFDSCTCLVGFTTIVFCFNLQNFSISQQSNQYVLIDPYMAPPKKFPKTMAFNTKSYEVMANSWMIWGKSPSMSYARGRSQPTKKPRSHGEVKARTWIHQELLGDN